MSMQVSFIIDNEVVLLLTDIILPRKSDTISFNGIHYSIIEIILVLPQEYPWGTKVEVYLEEKK